ncbi:MAG TPA: SRPBCC family protein [Gaiellaceae bacterium]|nr:SRPBCC family protein [Gaiellaceae bacterium]
MASEASRELLAPREDVWTFLAEPYHLPDWWPGITGVEPDRRGFAPGARWKVQALKRNVFTGARSVETMLLVREIDLYERWSWHLLAPETDTEIRLRSSAPDRTVVTVTTSARFARAAVQRLYDLVQTAAGFR